MTHSLAKPVKSAFSSSHQAKMGHLPGLRGCLVCPRESHFTLGLFLLPCFLVFPLIWFPLIIGNVTAWPALRPRFPSSDLHFLYSVIIHPLRVLLRFCICLLLNSAEILWASVMCSILQQALIPTYYGLKNEAQKGYVFRMTKIINDRRSLMQICQLQI